MKDLAWLEISKNNLIANIKALKGVLGSKTALGVSVKANAYGHDLIKASKMFLASGADWLCVNSFEELEKLRSARVRCPVLIIGYVPPEQIKKAIIMGATLFGFDYGYLKIISKEASKIGQKAKIYLKIDTGMSRQGILAEEISNLLKKIKPLPYLSIAGLSTHFSTADEKINNKYFLKQLSSFQKAAQEVQSAYKSITLCCANSAAAMIYPQARFDFVRVGISAYGYYPSNEVRRAWEGKPLRPALSFKTRIAHLKNIPANSSVGYGATFRTSKPTQIAILPIGYYDGLDRKLSNKGEILVSGKRAKIIGRICMNLTMIDITGIKSVKIGDEVVIIGRQGREQITADDIAEKIGTISYEVLTRLRENLNKYYI